MPVSCGWLLRGFVVAIVAGCALLPMACLAPMCRTTEIPPGLTLSTHAGPTVFGSVGFVNDTSSWWSGRTVGLTCVGAQGDLRLGCGFARWFGADLTAGLSYGWPVNRPESLDSRIPGFSRLALAAQFRPWQRNSLAFVEYQFPHFFSVGWVSGFPLHCPEQWSVMAQTGFVPYYVATHTGEPTLRDFAPEKAQLALRRNFRLGRTTLAPSLGATIGWNWEDFGLGLSNGTLGIIWSLPTCSPTTLRNFWRWLRSLNSEP